MGPFVIFNYKFSTDVRRQKWSLIADTSGMNVIFSYFHIVNECGFYAVLAPDRSQTKNLKKP